MGIWQRLHDRVCGAGQDCLAEPANDRLSLAIREEEYESLRLAIWLRFAVCAAVALLLTFELRWPIAFNYYGYIAALAFSGYLQLLMRKPPYEREWMLWVFPLIDMMILVGGIVLPNPFDPHPVPPPMRLSFDTILYVIVFVVLSGLGQSAKTVMLTTGAAIVAWTAGTLFLTTLPGVTFVPNLENIATQTAEERLAYLMNPWNVRLGELLPRLVIIALVGIIMAVAVTRFRHLVARQVETERARRNLSRHFSPHIAETLAQMDDALGQVKRLDAVVLFADLVGFTQVSDDLTPEQTVTLLRGVHRCLAKAVAENNGTLDKYLGDGIMASFGTPEPGPRDASAALLAARCMLREMEQLNRQRALLRQAPLTLAIGLHYGPLTLGNIGDESRLEYALIGETVNVAHRLEQMTRVLNTQLCASQAFIDRLGEETRGDTGPIADLVALQPQPIRGLRDRMVVWIRQRPEAEAEPTGAVAAPTLH
jgi:adenylate cyclase